MTNEKPELKYDNTVEGIFLQRNNRFSAEVMIGNVREAVHVKNTGRLKDLLVPNAKVILQRNSNPNRTTGYDLISVYKSELEWVNIDSLAPNVLVKQYLEPLYDVVKPEHKYGDSRFDFYMEKGEEKYLMEVKGCTLAENPKKGIGYFPDASTERGVKHLNELINAAREGYHCTIAFVIQMNGIHYVFPNDAIQPEFGQALVRAAKAGVEIVYHTCRVEADSIRITGTMGDTSRYMKA